MYFEVVVVFVICHNFQPVSEFRRTLSYSKLTRHASARGINYRVSQATVFSAGRHLREKRAANCIIISYPTTESRLRKERT